MRPLASAKTTLPLATSRFSFHVVVHFVGEELERTGGDGHLDVAGEPPVVRGDLSRIVGDLVGHPVSRSGLTRWARGGWGACRCRRLLCERRRAAPQAQEHARPQPREAGPRDTALARRAAWPGGEALLAQEQSSRQDSTRQQALAHGSHEENRACHDHERFISRACVTASSGSSARLTDGRMPAGRRGRSRSGPPVQTRGRARGVGASVAMTCRHAGSSGSTMAAVSLSRITPTTSGRPLRMPPAEVARTAPRRPPRCGPRRG